MARPLRIVDPGLWHHVMNRGGGGAALFLDDSYRRKFISLMAECGERWGVRTAAYCAMRHSC